MTHLHTRFPWIVSFALALLFLLIALVGTPIGTQIETLARLPQNSGILIQQAMLVIFSALAVTVFGGWRSAGFDSPIKIGAVLMCLPPLAAPIIMLFYTGFAPSGTLQLLMLLVFSFMIGFAEEALCRGVMVAAFLPKGGLQAALYSSLIFGSMHLIHIFYGMDVATALLYAFYASLIGFGLAAPFLRGRSGIWPVIIVHSLFDLLGKLGHGWGAQAQPTTSVDAIVRLSVAILVGAYGYWLIRGLPRTEGAERPLTSLPRTA
jgi:membrane protease YdiL (CAAX protease family)